MKNLGPVGFLLVVGLGCWFGTAGTPHADAWDKGASAMQQLGRYAPPEVERELDQAPPAALSKCTVVEVVYVIPDDQGNLTRRVRVTERICAPCKPGLALTGFSRTTRGRFYNVCELKAANADLCYSTKSNEALKVVPEP
jgi:hypothetical protein